MNKIINKMNAIEIQKRACESIEEALNVKPESICAIEKNGSEWRVEAEILERKAVPNKFDLLKVFEFKLDGNGKVNSFKLLRRKQRGDLD